MAVGDGNGSWSHDGINEAILAVGHGNMVNPDVGWAKDGDTITITLGPNTNVVVRIPDKPAISRDDVMDMNVMDDHIIDKLEGEAGTKSYVHIGSPTVDGFVAGHDQLLIEPNNHAVCKDNPEGPFSGNGVPDGSRSWINHVVVGGIGHYVNRTTFSAGDSVAKAKDAPN